MGFSGSQSHWRWRKIIYFLAGLYLAAVTHAFALPTITTQPVSRAADLGNEVVFSVTAVSALPITYQWRKGTNNLAGETSDILVFTSVQTNDAGSYTVVVSDASGSVTSQVATLTVDTAFTKITVGAIVNDGGASGSAAWADYDNDGWLDLFVANAGAQNDFLYHNNRDGTFARITAGVVANDGADSRRAAWGDYDNDGNLDLFVTTTTANNLLYRNNGDGTFARITNSPAITNAAASSGTSWADYDNDGNLDLFVSNFPGPKYLFRNNGNGMFTKVTNSILVNELPGNSSGNTWGDYDNDGDLDVFICTPQGNNVLYRNDGGGNFTKITTGIVVNEGGVGFGCAWGDYDNDGWLDLFVCNGGLAATANNFLYHNNGDGTFTKITNGVIVNDSGSSVRCAWGDYDNDSFLDLFVADYAGNNRLFHNNGDGTFTKITTGSLVNEGGHSAGCVWGDYDNDGFLDLFVANGFDAGSENNFLYRNNGNANSWIKLRLGGFPSNRSGVGAKVKVNAVIGGTNRWLTRSIEAGDHSGNASALLVGLANASNIVTLRIEWPSGTVQELHNVAVKQALTVLEATNGPPIFHTQPQSQLLVTHSNVTLRAMVASLSPLTYQWHKDAVAIPGATNTTLTISNTQISDGGSYALKASNSLGATFSQSAVLTVAPLFLVTQPQSVNVRASSNTTFSVIVLSSLPLTYQWRFNGTNIASETNATFTITNAQVANEGVYAVMITNSEISVLSQSANLLLYANPAILQAPLSQTVVEGGNVTVSLVITGNPPPFLYQWRRGTSVAGTLTNIVLNERTCFFTLTNVQVSEGGQYRVLITNAAISTLSIGALFTLTVLPDTNTNGLPDDWEATYGVTNPAADPDGDRLNNLEEYIAGTNPTNALSHLRIDPLALNSRTVQFVAVSNRTYTVEFTETLGSGVWTKLADTFARATNRVERVIDPSLGSRRYYRLVTPRQP